MQKPYDLEAAKANREQRLHELLDLLIDTLLQRLKDPQARGWAFLAATSLALLKAARIDLVPPRRQPLVQALTDLKDQRQPLPFSIKDEQAATLETAFSQP